MLQLVSLLSSWLCCSVAVCLAASTLSLSWSSLAAATVCFSLRGLTTSRRPRNRMSSLCDSTLCADSSVSNSIIANKPCTANTSQNISSNWVNMVSSGSLYVLPLSRQLHVVPILPNPRSYCPHPHPIAAPYWPYFSHYHGNTVTFSPVTINTTVKYIVLAPLPGYYYGIVVVPITIQFFTSQLSLVPNEDMTWHLPKDSKLQCLAWELKLWQSQFKPKERTTIMKPNHPSCHTAINTWTSANAQCRHSTWRQQTES